MPHANSPPTPPELALTPEAPVAGDTLWCTLQTASTDADGDALTYHFEWTVDGLSVESAGDAELESWVDGVEAEELWTCTVVADDGQAQSSPATASVTVAPDCDLDGDGYPEAVINGYYDGSSYQVNSYIHWGDPDGYAAGGNTAIPGEGVWGEIVIVGAFDE